LIGWKKNNFIRWESLDTNFVIELMSSWSLTTHFREHQSPVCDRMKFKFHLNLRSQKNLRQHFRKSEFELVLFGFSRLPNGCVTVGIPYMSSRHLAPAYIKLKRELSSSYFYSSSHEILPTSLLVGRRAEHSIAFYFSRISSRDRLIFI
jgi:hypothetical protein